MQCEMQNLRTATCKSVSVSRARVVRVVAQRAVNRKTQVVLTRDVPNLGKDGELKAVPVGQLINLYHNLHADE